MSEPKSATRVDSKQLVSKLLDAFNSLKTTSAPGPRSSPRSEEQPPPPQLQAQLQEGPAKAFELVAGIQSKISADPRPVVRTPLKALVRPVSDIEEGKPEPIPAFESAENSETPADPIEAQPTPDEIIEEFCGDDEALDRLQVTSRELHALSNVSLLGSLTCRQDVLFVLRQIRKAKNPKELEATVAPEPLSVPDEKIEPSIPYISEMSERIRREALAKVAESYSQWDARYRGTARRFGVSSLARGLTSVMTWCGIR